MELLPSRKANVDDFWSIQDYKSANHEPTSQHEHESVGDYIVSRKRNLCAGRTTMRKIKMRDSSLLRHMLLLVDTLDGKRIVKVSI